jgi:hypothetical protein
VAGTSGMGCRRSRTPKSYARGEGFRTLGNARESHDPAMRGAEPDSIVVPTPTAGRASHLIDAGHSPTVSPHPRGAVSGRREPVIGQPAIAPGRDRGGRRGLHGPAGRRRPVGSHRTGRKPPAHRPAHRGPRPRQQHPGWLHCRPRARSHPNATAVIRGDSVRRLRHRTVQRGIGVSHAHVKPLSRTRRHDHWPARSGLGGGLTSAPVRRFDGAIFLSRSVRRL